MKQKGLAPILIVLILAVILIGGYLVFTNLPAGRQGYSNNRTDITPQQTTQPSPTTDASPVPNGAGASGAPTGDAETANWKTYTSKNCGFSFKYPENWETYSYGHTPNEEPLDYCGPSLAEERFLRPKGTEAAGMDLQVSPLKGTAYGYLEKTFKESAEVKNIKIDSINALSKIVSLPNGKRVGSALFKNGDYVYQLSALDENSISIFDQILSTFKFQ